MTLFVLVLVEALAVLLSIPLRVNHSFKKDARAVFGVPGSLVERLLNGKTSIKTDAGQVTSTWW